MFRAAYDLVFSSFWKKDHQEDEDISDAVSDASKILEGMGQGLKELLISVECATNKEEIELGFDKINNILRLFLRLSPGRKAFKAVRESIKSMGISATFEEHLMRSFKLEEALLGWKIFVLQKSWTRLKNREEENKRMKFEDTELISRFFPKHKHNHKRAKVKFQDPNHVKKRRKLNKAQKRTGFTAKQFSTMKRKGICYYFQGSNCQKGDSCQYKHLKC